MIIDGTMQCIATAHVGHSGLSSSENSYMVTEAVETEAVVTKAATGSGAWRRHNCNEIVRTVWLKVKASSISW